MRPWLHEDEAGRKRHEELGFHEGWGKCADQLVEVAKQLRKGSDPSR